ncbi:hypothetical protein LPJ55_004743 [Coemansia sp. RSA 990]|nr:hypothetical protein BX667DRAFT_190211 [Coemansia mojavensis]KAJ1739903.1 hypothetical protein LPJ68_004248 [Coemansia sp. RSA 1086]KAJ1870346.1 hypothetical protein LPJ55_004743 [Coemansia sp. RSA 990]
MHFKALLFALPAVAMAQDGNLVDNIISGAGSVFNQATSGVGNAVDHVTSGVDNAVDHITSGAVDGFSHLTSGAVDNFNDLTSNVESGLSRIESDFNAGNHPNSDSDLEDLSDEDTTSGSTKFTGSFSTAAVAAALAFAQFI